MGDLRDRYLSIVARVLTGVAWKDPPIDLWHGVIRDASGKAINPREIVTPGVYRVEPGVYDPAVRDVGGDWPATALTMIGTRRLAALREAIETIVRERIPGDFLEAGVWRGGACIFMRAVLEGLDDTRRVWACDSFAGLPPPTHEADKNDPHSAYSTLAVPLEEVRAAFQAFDFLDDRTVFLKGLFADTIATADTGPLALLRLDGDMYGSTMDVLNPCYPKLAPGGYCVIDDYNLPGVIRAVDEYVKTHDLKIEAHRIDRCGIYWRK